MVANWWDNSCLIQAIGEFLKLGNGRTWKLRKKNLLMSLSHHAHWTNISWIEMVNRKRQVNEITWSSGKKWCLLFALKWPRKRVSISLQSWTKVIGTVLQYSYASVNSRFPLKIVHPFRNFLAVLPPLTSYKVETREKFWIHASNIVCGVRGRGLTCVNWKTPQKRKSVPRLLSMIVVLKVASL